MKFSRLIILIAFMLSAKLVSAQEVNMDSLVNNFVKALEKKNIDTVCIYQEYCEGCFPNRKSDCITINWLPTHIFWRVKGKTYMTRKDNCFDYSTIIIKKDEFWDFYFKFEDTIKKEEMKMPQYRETRNGKEIIETSVSDHARHVVIKTIIGNKTVIDKDINESYLEKEIGYHDNINYGPNANSALNRISVMLKEIVFKTTKSGALKKTKR